MSFTITYHIKTSLSWRLYWNLVSQKKRWLKGLLKVSAADARNKGSIFNFDEFRQLLTAKWNPDSDYDFVTWYSKRFPAVTLLLGALRSEQLDRFRGEGYKGLTFLRDNLDNRR